MPFIGKNPTAGFASIVKDDFTGNGSTTVFTLSKQVATANDIAVFVGNVRQEPTDAYTVSGTTLTMSAAPATGINFYVLHIAGTIESSVVPPDGSIGTAKLVNDAVTSAKIAAGAVDTTELASGAVTSAKLDTNIDIAGTLTTDGLTSDGNVSIVGQVGVNTSGNTVTGRFGTGVTVRRAVPEVHLKRDDNQGEGGILLDNASSTQRLFVGTYNANQETHIGTNGTQRLVIDTNGYVTMPNQPAFMAYKNGNQSLTAHTLTKITGWTEAVDQSNSWDNGVGTFTAPSAGIYLFGILMQSNVNGGLHLMVRKNGNNGIYGDNYLDGGDLSGSSYTILMPMVANDYVEYFAYLTVNGNINSGRSKVWAVKVA